MAQLQRTIMNATSHKDDPFGVLRSTASVVEDARSVSIDLNSIDDMAERIISQLQQGLEPVGEHFGALRSSEDDVQLIFLEDVVNFCFWAERDQPKWSIEYPASAAPLDGWYALVGCFERALAEGVPILDARFLA